MTWQQGAADVMLVIGVGVELLCCVGLITMDTGYDRMHFLGPATTVGPMAIAAAIVLDEALSTAGIKAVVIAVVLLGGGPVLSHALLRVARTHGHGSWSVRPSEHIEEV
jgi:multisubunit Na+/H+ antiporter MnhG subunit